MNSMYQTEQEFLAAKAEHQAKMVFPIGEVNPVAQYFSGETFLSVVSEQQVTMYNVTFEPNCKNNWHIHHASKGGGQVLICVAGFGYYQEWGKEKQLLKPGDVVHIPANVKHWHGATEDSWFSHLAVEVDGEDMCNEWCEPVEE